MADDQKPDHLRIVRGPPDPETGLTPKQEAFAQAVARDGNSYSAAYRLAYDTSNMSPGTIYTEASLLAASPKIAQRLQEIVRDIKQENSAQAETRAERVLKTLETLMLNAKTDAARLRAAELLGKTVGLYRDVQETRETGATVAELEAQLSEMLRKTGS